VGAAISLIEEKGIYELGSDGGQFLLRPEKAGLLHWQCKSGFSEGSFVVRSFEGGDPQMQGLPMADQIAALIERSAKALESLRHQLHP